MSIYLSIPGIEGDTIVAGHEGEMQLTAFSNTVAHLHNPAEASSQVAGLVTAPPIAVNKYVDRSTPELIQACCDGKVYDGDIVITHTKKVGEETVDYFTITLSKAQIVDHSISSGDDGVPSEAISIGYGEITWFYQQFEKGGEPGETKEATYNVLEQQKA